MTIDWTPLRTIFENNQRFVLSSHARPDADALGSELAVAGMLESMGKSVRIVNPSAMPDSLTFLDPGGRIMKIGEGITPDEIADTDVHIVLDTSAWVQLGKVGSVLKTTTATKVVIDHHVSSDNLGAIEFKDTKAEATGAMVFRMAEALDYPITRDMAVALFAAITTDTGWFRFPSTTSDTMRIAGRLIDAGARPAVIYQLLYERFSATRIKLVGRALTDMQLVCEGRLAYTVVTQADFKATGAKPVETEDIVNECLRIEGTQAAFIAIEQQNGNIKYSFRSRTNLNVAAVAEQFGGGGHKQASGAILPGPLAEAQEKVLAAFKTVLADG
ncbi:MAG: bifunctional oligoribonuclease/PAP phosphatase NrnA [Planctomycetaceae bacterium]|jgi:bifunctional oligoribonuclease and PAP phosphatase NrnA|nr:bifunctional oligoribonuclease/PAP phosphatase NrnA [Planctomycetaceae bacterium]MBT6154311.1 bifunctional oligoribonuclease/PAP phosphatase NrnA [Planctomycetaceae bacterium]MBT6485611.1 bifunctional oligoribonuclease/PAP phosphatase NrnA [Planctomycetaceae bacterium]MBT6495001.1 bifunctional oligoribonuclease/PAP phosphatase NrnA [Planctomycetaceae bacterium]